MNEKRGVQTSEFAMALTFVLGGMGGLAFSLVDPIVQVEVVKAGGLVVSAYALSRAIVKASGNRR